MRHIVFVESPNKQKKIEQVLKKRFPNEEWNVFATTGHIKHLPSNQYSLKFTDDDYYANFLELDAWKQTKALIEKFIIASNEQTDFYVATDSDREGEVIASCPSCHDGSVSFASKLFT